MKALIGFAVLLSPAPSLAATGADGEGARSERERRICTRIERHGGSRLSYQRVCLTEAEWRERLGADWRQALTGRTVEDDYDSVDVRSRVVREQPAGYESPN